MIQIYFDGAYDYHSHQMGLGVIAYSEYPVEFFQVSKQIKEPTTHSNNVAEYLALIEAMRYCVLHQVQKEPIEVFGDSQLVIKQMQGLMKVKEGAYVASHYQAMKLRQQFKWLKFTWIPRELNTIADKLSKGEMI